MSYHYSDKAREGETSGSWVGFVTANRGSFLLGFTKHATSSRFETRKQASAWVAQCLEANCESHRSVAAWGETWHDKAPEITEAEAPVDTHEG